MDLQYNLEFHHPADPAELRRMLGEFRQSDPEAVFWLLDDGEPILSLLTSGERACLCHEPTMAWSCSETAVDPEATVPFRLENGQVDDIPADSVIALAEIVRFDRLAIAAH